MAKVVDPTRHYLWFGTREHMQQIPMPRYDADISGVGWNSQIQYLDGRSFVRRSTTSHREYQFSWNLANRQTLQPVFDYAAGLYGPAPYYFIDPFSFDTNALPEWWAAPGMALDDAPILVGEDRPQKITNSDFSYGYPSRGAAYTVAPSMDRQRLWIPIPPGMTLWVGAHGPATSGAYVEVKPFTTPITANPGVALSNIPVSSAVRCNTHFRSEDGYIGVEISLQGTGTLQLFGLIAQVLKTLVDPNIGGSGTGYGSIPYGEGPYGGTPYVPFDPNLHPYPGAFMGGMGHSGCEFKEHPTRQGYSSALDLIGSAATLIEIGGD